MLVWLEKLCFYGGLRLGIKSREGHFGSVWEWVGFLGAVLDCESHADYFVYESGVLEVLY